MKKKTLLSIAIATVAVATLGVTSVMAADVIDTVIARDGDVKDVVAMSAEVTSVDGSHVTFVDSETGTEYSASFGPSWFTKAYEVGDIVELEGVETVAENNDNGHDFQVTVVDDITLREFEGKPAWAGQRGNGDGAGEHRGGGQGHKGMGGSGFVDADGDGVCDLAQ